MTLLYITGYGWAAIAIIVLSVFLGVKILKRMNPQTKPGCLGIGYVSLVVFCLLGLSAGLSGAMTGFVSHAFTLPRYEARVVSTSSYLDKDSQKRTITMYRSTVAFTLKNGTPVTIETDMASSGEREIGETVTVCYQPGMEKAEEMTTGKYLLVGGAAVMLLIMGYCVIGGLQYAFGGGMAGFYRIGMGLLMYFIFPLAMLFLLCGMGYAVVMYFMGLKPDMPVWAVAVCILFCLILALALLGYFRMLTQRKRNNP